MTDIPKPPRCPSHWPPSERTFWRSGWKAGYEQATKDMEDLEIHRNEADEHAGEMLQSTCGFTVCTHPGHMQWVPIPDNWVGPVPGHDYAL